MIDLDAYLARIGCVRPPRPDLQFLEAVHSRHPQAIPFENFDSFLNRPVAIDLEALQEKLVRRRRGGYCFEQNTLFKAVLEQVGYRVVALAARVLWMMDPDQPPNPRTHMCLTVELENGRYIADVGFGGLLLSAPLRLEAGLRQETTFGAFRFSADDGFWILQAELSAGWRDVYRFTLEPQFAVDLELANWFVSTHPKSRFRNILLIERLRPDARLSLYNRRLTLRPQNGAPEQRIIASPNELDRVLAEMFDLEPPADIEALFERLPV